MTPHADELLDQALSALEGGHADAAEALAREGLARHADDAGLWSLAGLCAHLRQDEPAAEADWRQAMRLAPSAPVCRRLVALLTQQGRRAEALACQQALVAATPDDPAAQVDLGVLLAELGHWPDAEQAYRHALALRPDDVAAHTNLGLVLEKTRRYAEAEQHQRRACALALQVPDAVGLPATLAVLCHLGNLLARTDRAEEAEALYRQALQRDPGSAMAHTNLGVLCFDLGRLDEAEACFRAALALRPEASSARLNLGQLLLTRGDFAEGWAQWDRRYDVYTPGALPAFPRDTGRARRWRGEPLAGQRLLVWPEQGHGDQVQFARCLAPLKALGPGWLTLACSAPLRPLLQRVAGPDEVIALDQGVAALQSHDLWVPLLGLPHLLGHHLDSDPVRTDPAPDLPVPPYLHTDPVRAAQWAARVAAFGAPAMPAALRVGLVWRGHALHDNDADRSLPGLQPLAPLWSVPGVQWISLQKGAGEDQAQSPPLAQPLSHLGSDIADFADTAALLQQLDLLISVDTAAAHVAGALGMPCWVLLPARRCDWRWLRGRDDSPWYPSVRLFRQATRGDWATPVAAMREALDDFTRVWRRR
jgi:Flp pilus assembly protein TadD